MTAGAAEDLPRLFGTMELLRLLGRGDRGLAFVMRSPDGALDQFRSIKILPPALSTDPALLAALRQEAGSLVRRIHNNLVPILDVGQVGNQVFFVTELVEGRDLAALLAAASGGGRRFGRRTGTHRVARGQHRKAGCGGG